jgi:hypothetical protein
MPLKNRHTKKKNTNRRRKQIKRGGKRFRKNTKKNVRNKRQTRRMRGGYNDNTGLSPYNGDYEQGFYTKPARTQPEIKYSMRNRDKFEKEFKDIIPTRSWKQWWNNESNISELIDIVGKLKDETNNNLDIAWNNFSRRYPKYVEINKGHFQKIFNNVSKLQFFN